MGAKKPSKHQSITTEQIKMIHTLKNAMTLDDQVYRESIYNLFRVTSSKDLDCEQATSLIEVMKDTALKFGVWEERADKRKRFNDLGERGGMASPEQLRKIEAQWQEVSRVEQPEDKAKALRHFVERIAKVSDLRFLDFAGAGKVLNALKAMLAKKTGGKRKSSKTAV